MEDKLKLRFLEGSAMPLFVVELQVFQVIQAECVKLGVLLLAKFNWLCFEMLTELVVTFFVLQLTVS